MERPSNSQPRSPVSAARRLIRGMLRFGKRSMYPPRTADLAGTRPVSRSFGYDRGTPVDRLYIEEFLAAHSAYVTGRVLEVGESTYSTRFGKGVTRQDVLHVRDDPRATLVADLGAPDSLPENAFDCIILTQTLHLIYDMPAAVRELRRALRPGGVALVTVPGVSSVDVGEWGSCWCWSLTGHSALKLFGSEFGEQNVDVVVYGNVYAATSFLHGLAVEELDRGNLNVRDPAYPVLVGVCARRAAA